MTQRNSVAIETLLSHAEWAGWLARALMQNAQDAQDIVQEAWLDGLRHPPDDRGPVRPWLATVLRRKRGHHRASEARRHEVEQQACGDWTEGAIDAESTLARFHIHKQIADHVDRLPEPYRSTVLLRFFDGKSSEEIGHAAGVPAATVRWRLNKAIAMLRAELTAKDAEMNAPGWRKSLAILGGIPESRIRTAPSAKSARWTRFAGIAFAVSATTGLAYVWLETHDDSVGRNGAETTGASVLEVPTPPPPQLPTSAGHPLLPGGALSVAAARDCQEAVRQRRRQVERAEAEAREAMMPDELYSIGEPNQVAGNTLAPLVARIMKGKYDSAPPYVFDCRAWACRMVVLHPKGTTHERTNDWMHALQTDVESRKLVTASSFKDIGHVADPISGEVLNQTRVFIKLRDPAGDGEPSTHVKENWPPIPDEAGACKRVLDDLGQRLQRARNVVLQNRPLHEQFAETSANPTLTRWMEGVVAKVLGGTPEEIDVLVECRGQICGLMGPERLDTWTHRIDMNNEVHLRIKTMMVGHYSAGMYLHLKSDEEIIRDKEMARVIDEAMTSPHARRCADENRQLETLSVSLSGHGFEVVYRGDDATSAFGRCIAMLITPLIQSRAPDIYRGIDGRPSLTHNLKVGAPSRPARDP
jgi:RNA polymerase sigma factor (sigma-70 family)